MHSSVPSCSTVSVRECPLLQLTLFVATEILIPECIGRRKTLQTGVAEAEKEPVLHIHANLQFEIVPQGYNFAAKRRALPAKKLPCEESAASVTTRHGKMPGNAEPPALACAHCGQSGSCFLHAQLCPKCGEPVCAYCEDQHAAKEQLAQEMPWLRFPQTGTGGSIHSQYPDHQFSSV